MNNDYLWDRTGEPDAEVQELEDVLGTLRYQPRPLELPAEAQPAPRSWFFFPLAIAAAIALMVLAAGVWIRLHRQPSPTEVARSSTEPVNSNQPPVTSPPTTGRGDEPGIRPDKSRVIAAPRRNPAPRNTKRNNILPRRDEMTATQRAEGEAAKDQLLLALRVASAKLNLAQRKTVGAPTSNNIRNQHKLG